MITNLNIDAISDGSIPASKLQDAYALSTTPPNDEIWYTSTDGNIVTPYKTDVFGANIVSNTYENGKGIILFDGNVTSIGDMSFHGCSTLTEITIPNSVTSIRDMSFQGCSALTEVTIPNSVTSIREMSFYHCYNLVSVYLKSTTPPNLDSTAFMVNASGRKIYVPIESVDVYKAASRWSNYADLIVGCVSEDETLVPGENIKTINGKSILGKGNIELDFKNFPSNDEIWYTSTDGNVVLFSTEATEDDGSDPQSSFGANVVSNTYENGKGVIKFDGEINAIGVDAFWFCDSLKSITIPNSVTMIGVSAFYGCSSLTNINIPDSVTFIGDSTFSGCTSLTSIAIPDSVTEIGGEAFNGCTSLKSITIPDGVTSIRNGVFYDCSSLTSITIPDSVTSIRYEAFSGCSSLKSITIPDSVTSIGYDAFHSCTSLTSITIGKGVTDIGDLVCYGCNKLKTVYCKPTTPPSLSDPMLIEMGIKTYVPIESVDAYKTATYWDNFPDHIIGCVFEDEALVSGENIKTINGKSILGEGNIELSSSKNLPSDDELWYISVNNNQQYAFEGAFGDSRVVSHTYKNGIGVIKFNKTLTEIAMDVFGPNENVVSVYIPEKVTRIGRSAFGNLSLTDVFMSSKTAPELYDANVFGPWSTSSNLKIWIPNDSLSSYIGSSDAWQYYGMRSKGYIKGGENLIPGKNISTINGRSIIGSADFKLVTKNDNGYVEESLIPSTVLELGSSSNPWYYVHVQNLKGYGEFLINTNGDDWSLGTPTEGNDECNISGESGSMLLKSKGVIIRGKEGVTITDDGYMGDITLSSYTAVNIVAGDEGSGQGTINVTPGAVMVDGYFYCSDNFEVNTNGECYATAFYETSDENLKDFTDDITVDFNKLKEIRKSYFTWKDGDQNLHIGTSAQDIQKVYPELVSKDNEGNLTVDYAKLSIIALSAIDKLDERLSRIENILNKEE